jgi:hypothetical protein
MELGRWFTRPVNLTREKISQFLKADNKRDRENYNSYQLVKERKSIDSKSKIYDNFQPAEIPPKEIDYSFDDDE